MNCTNCGTKTRSGVSIQTYKFDGHTFQVEVPARLCPKCDEDFVTADNLRRAELLVGAELFRRGIQLGTGIKHMRKSLGLAAKDAASLLGVAAETFSRWETGATEVQRPAFAVLGALVLDELFGSSGLREALEAKPQLSPGTSEIPFKNPKRGITRREAKRVASIVEDALLGDVER